MQSKMHPIDELAGVQDVIIVGGGVTGTALAKVLCQYTNIESVALLEKESAVAEVNSNPDNNAQTSHDGSTETNYSLAHALEVQWKAALLRHYAFQKNDPTLFQITTRMALGIGEDEVATLKERYVEFKPYYPDLTLAGKAKLTELEPKIMEGRGRDEPVIGLVSDQGYAINYKRLSEHMLDDAKNYGRNFKVFFNTEVDYKTVRRQNGIYILQTVNNETGVKIEMKAKVVVFAAGAFSLLFAQQLGYAKNFTIFPVAGSFFSGGNLLNGKVYRVQIEGMPFAAIHGDKDILNSKDTRFGPTTKPLPLMERHHYETISAYFRTGILSWGGIKSILKILFTQQMLWYVFKNTLYDIPLIGKLLFIKEVRKIIPSIRFKDLKLRRGKGGIRPQVVNMKTGKLEMGDSCIVEDNLIFNTTPSPGASICLGNAVRDAEQVTKFLGGRFRFDRAKLLNDLNVEDREVKHEVMVNTAKVA